MGDRSTALTLTASDYLLEHQAFRLNPRYRPIRGETDVEAPALWRRHMLSRAPALALSCREADNLGEADRTPTNRIRSVSAGRTACLHLPRSAL